MKSQVFIVLLLISAMAVSGCANTSLAASTGPLTVEDRAALISALEHSGVTVEIGEPVSQVFFSAEGNILKVNDADVQVFEYESAEEMENEASQVSSDGGSIGTSMVTWMDVPHFYKAGRIIVLYVGNDAAVLDLLKNALSDNTVAGAMRFDRLNPQTQETSFPFKGTAFGRSKPADQMGVVVFGESNPDDVSGGEGSDKGFAGDGDGFGGP